MSEGTASQLPTVGAAASAEQRLLESRLRLQAFLQSGANTPRQHAAGRVQHSFSSSLLELAQSTLFGPAPAAGERTDSRASRDLLAPLAQRHPLALVGSAVMFGSLLMWSRPWRWLLRPALLGAIASQLATRLVARVPIERLLGAAVANFGRVGRQPVEPRRADFPAAP